MKQQLLLQLQPLLANCKGTHCEILVYMAYNRWLVLRWNHCCHPKCFGLLRHWWVLRFQLLVNPMATDYDVVALWDFAVVVFGCGEGVHERQVMLVAAVWLQLMNLNSWVWVSEYEAHLFVVAVVVGIQWQLLPLENPFDLAENEITN